MKSLLEELRDEAELDRQYRAELDKRSKVNEPEPKFNGEDDEILSDED